MVSKELGARAGAGIGRKEAAYVGDWAWIIVLQVTESNSQSVGYLERS